MFASLYDNGHTLDTFDELAREAASNLEAVLYAPVIQDANDWNDYMELHSDELDKDVHTKIYGNTSNAPPYYPIWQVYPVDVSLINYNLDLGDGSFITPIELPNRSNLKEPLGIIRVPVMNSTKVVGYVGGLFVWSRVLGGAAQMDKAEFKVIVETCKVSITMLLCTCESAKVVAFVHSHLTIPFLYSVYFSPARRYNMLHNQLKSTTNA
jgi:hypothetical protein